MTRHAVPSPPVEQAHGIRWGVRIALGVIAAAVAAAGLGGLRPPSAHANPAKIWVINDNVAALVAGVSPASFDSSLSSAGGRASYISQFDAIQTASAGQVAPSAAIPYSGNVFIVAQTDGSLTNMTLNGHGLVCTPACDGLATTTPDATDHIAVFKVTDMGSHSSGDTLVATVLQDAVSLDSRTITVVGQAHNLTLTTPKTTIQEGMFSCSLTDSVTSPARTSALATFVDINSTPLVGYVTTWSSSWTPTLIVAVSNTISMLQADGTTVAARNVACGVAVGSADLHATNTAPGAIIGIPGVVTRTQTITVTGLPASVALVAVPALITCDGAHTSTVTATVRDAASNLVVDNTPVNFSVVALGTANPINTLTAGGTASTTVAPFPGAIGVTVIVTSGNAQNSIGVLCAAPPPPAVPHVSSGGTSTTLEATLAGAQANTVYRVDLFSSASCSGSVSGGTFIGAFSTSSDGTGHIKLIEMLSTGVAVGQVIQATATDPYNYTSPVSACQSVVARACTDDTTCNGYTDAQKIALGKDPFTYCAIMRADVNNSGTVTLADLILTAQQYNEAIPPANARNDQNADGKITLADLILEAGNYNKSVSGCP